MARLVEWHHAHAWNAKRLRFRSAVRGRRFREQLRRIDCRRQRPVLVRPAEEKILRYRCRRVRFGSSFGAGTSENGDEQRKLFGLLNEIVRNTSQFRAAEAASKLVRLSTGDGIVLAFFTTVDVPVRCALEISRKLREHPELKLRMGINSGPVDQVSDVNEQRNITGVGINMAQRLMDCGDAGHILLSRRVADDLAQYSEWKAYLHDLGQVEVKHGVTIDVVNFYDDEVGNAELPEKLNQARREGKARADNLAHARRRKRM